ncbi:MAG: GEVED domain-containing protein, partial [Vicingaceae bacterium]|nr:GEVED domain-containing protein [Vicingaceae bacterium]
MKNNYKLIIALIFILINQFSYGQYCASGATSTADSGCNGVQLAGNTITLNNPTTNCGTYTDHTSGVNVPDMTPGSSYTVNVTNGTCGGNYGRVANVWIDFNNDNDFLDANEMLGTGTVNNATAGFVHVINFTVPVAATIGNLRMRVIVQEGGTANNSCASYTWGETEDYTVNIVSPGPMTYSSYTVTQANTSNVNPGLVDNELLRVQINTTGNTSPISLTDLQFNLGGSSNIGDFTGNMKVYYTGSSTVFSTASLFGFSAVAAGTFNWVTVNGVQVLQPGANYFWLAVDVAPGATVSNVIDGRCRRAMVNGADVIPVVENPGGNRPIVSWGAVSPGGVSNNVTAWFDASNGTSTITDGAAMGTWSNSVTNVGVPSITSAGTARPRYQTNEINFNPVIEFDGVNDYLDQTSTLGSDLFGVGGNTIFMMHRFRSGLVYFKWEQGPTSSPRVGFERSAGKVRFDFPNDNGASQAVGTINFSGVGEIVTAHHESNLSTLRVNGAQDITKTTSGTFNNTTNEQFVIAANDFGNPLGFCNMDYAELIIYNAGISVSDMRKVESYMSVKYGVTMGGNGSGVGYVSAYGASIWDANTSYHNDVTGIAKDLVVQVLDQPKSQSINTGSTMPFTIAHNTIASPTSISTDNSYVVVGHDGGDVTNNTVVSYTHASTAIQVQLNRIFRVQTTNLPTGKAVNEMEVEIDMSSVPGLAGGFGLGAANAAAALRLLLDDNTTFGQGAVNERAYTNSGVSGNLIKFRIPFSDLPANGVYFFTIGSINGAIAPLPIELIAFNADCNKKIELNWTTASEINNDYFTVERSLNGVDFEALTVISGAGNSNDIKKYSWIDESNSSEVSYYRLKQTDFDGVVSYSDLKIASCDEEVQFGVYPNPTSNSVTLSFNSEINIQYQIVSLDGRVIQEGDFVQNKKL